MPCAYALASLKVPGRRWRTRAERLAVLDGVRSLILAGDRRDLAAFGREAGLSPYHLQRLFSVAFGESPKAMAERVRAERAAAMLRAGATTLQVVVSLQYAEASDLSRSFRRHHGLSPRDFCKMCQPQPTANGED